jgi:hypothetical protein
MNVVFGVDPLSTGVGSNEDENFSLQENLASVEVPSNVKHLWPQRVSMPSEMALAQGG